MHIEQLNHPKILAQVDLMCRHPLLEGELRPHLLRFLVGAKLKGRFNPPFTKEKPQPNGRMIVFEFYVERAKLDGIRPPALATYDDRPGKRLIAGLIDAVREFYNGYRGPEAKGTVLIEIPSGRGNAYEPCFSSLDRMPEPHESERTARITALSYHPAKLDSRTNANYGSLKEAEILGRWQYFVYSSDDRLSHCGDCQVIADGVRLEIRGERRYRLADLSSKSVVRVRSRWRTDWCEICRDGELRFVYYIDIQETKARTVKGFCQLVLGDVEMSGTYHLLPPFDADVTNAKNGTIVFNRIGSDGETMLPDGYVVREYGA